MSRTKTRVAVAMTISGSDSGGGAGIQADLKTFSALEVYGASVVTALTAQSTRGVSAVHNVPASFVTAQMEAVFSDIPVDAVKIGVVAEAAVVEVVAEGLARHGQKVIVLDPVMVSGGGDQLISQEAIEALISVLVPKVMLVTPNLAEAARLTGMPPAEDRDGMRRQAERILALGARNVLIKGGHAHGPESSDLLFGETGERWFSAKRVETENTHGSGSALSSAIAASLAKGVDLQDSISVAKAYVTAAIGAAGRLGIGHGRGPIHHFHALWTG